VGGKLFSDYSKHPKVKVWLPKFDAFLCRGIVE